MVCRGFSGGFVMIAKRARQARCGLSRHVWAGTAAAAFLAALSAVVLLRNDPVPRSAFADAPPGTYLVGAQRGLDEDVVVAIDPGDPSTVLEIGRVGHLPEYAILGSTSPDGSTIAIVTADHGTPGTPGVSLLFLDVRTGQARAALAGVDDGIRPAWAPAGDAVFVTRTRKGSGQLVDVELWRVPVRGTPAAVAVHERVLGAYVAGVTPGGEPVTVSIGAQGSLVHLAGASMLLSPNITRDWRLAPDGSAIAFIEADLAGGLRYRQRVVSFAGDSVAQSAPVGGQQLGVAWHPVASVPTFGNEPPAPTGDARAQRAPGFDLPIEFSSDGRYLAVEAWSGTSFAEPGSKRIAVVGDRSRAVMPVQAVLGWVSP
jgi:hypothetical protein